LCYTVPVFLPVYVHLVPIVALFRWHFGLFIMTVVMWDSPDYCVNCLDTHIKFSGQVSPHFWLIYLLLIFDIAIQFLNAALCDLWWSTVSYTKVLLILKATDQEIMGIVLNGLKLSSLYHLYWNYLPGILVNAKCIGSIAQHLTFNTPAVYRTTLCSTQQYVIPLHVQHINECHTTVCWTHLQYTYLFMLSISAGCDTSSCSSH
jgi:hypothetical protein